MNELFSGIAGIMLGVGFLVALLIFVGNWARKQAGVNLVISRWYANNQPDFEGRFISIEGRSGGLIMWILSKMGVDAESGISLSDSKVVFKEVSLAGSRMRIIPLSSISAVLFEYHKPWIASLVVFAVISRIGWLINWLQTVSGGAPREMPFYYWLGWILGVFTAVLYYFLNRKLTLGFAEHSGATSKIQFRRSIIENQEINPEQAIYVCSLAEALIENSRSIGNA